MKYCTNVIIKEEDSEKTYSYLFNEYKMDFVPKVPSKDAISLIEDSGDFISKLCNFYEKNFISL